MRGICSGPLFLVLLSTSGCPDGPGSPAADRGLPDLLGADRGAAAEAGIPDVSVADAPGDAAPAALRSLVLVGGGALGAEEAAILGRVVTLAGGKGKARIGVITAGAVPPSQDPQAGTSQAYNSQANGAWYVARFKLHGAADAQWIPLDLDRVSNNAAAKVVAQVKQMTGFIIGSGSQTRLLSCLVAAGHKDSPALAALRQRYEAGAVVAGTSAGATFLGGALMVTGGESYQALRHGAKTAADPKLPWALTYHAAGGAGLLTDGPLDTHCAERGRQGRLLRLAAHGGMVRAYCVDEATALVVTAAGTSAAQMEVLGAGGVSVLDLTQAKQGAPKPWSLTAARLTYLSHGDRFSPASGALTPPAWKTPLKGREWYTSPIVPSADIFSSPANLAGGVRKNPRELVRLSTRLVDHQSATSATGRSFETGPAFTVTLTRGAATAGYQGKQGGRNYYSYEQLQLDLVPQP